MSIEGFEPSPCYGIAPEATALDRSAKLTNLKISYIIILSSHEAGSYNTSFKWNKLFQKNDKFIIILYLL